MLFVQAVLVCITNTMGTFVRQCCNNFHYTVKIIFFYTLVTSRAQFLFCFTVDNESDAS